MIKIAKLVNLKCVKLIRNVDIVLAPENAPLLKLNSQFKGKRNLASEIKNSN